MRTQPSIGPGMARLAAVCGIVAVILQVLNIFAFTSGAPPSLSSSAHHIAVLAAQQRVSPEIGYYLDAFSTILMLVFALVLVRRVGETGGMWSSLVLAGIGLWAGIDMVWAAAIYAMRELAHYGTSSSGVLTLFFLNQAMLWIIALPVGLFFGALGMLALRTRIFPAVMGWVAVGLAVLIYVVTPFSSTVSAASGIILVASMLSLLWIVAAGILLLVRATTWAEPEVETIHQMQAARGSA